MEQGASSSIQVLLQAAEYLDRREREAEHGYASLCPTHSLGPVNRGRRRPKAPRDSLRSMHSELEKHRRAQLRHCLEQLKQQMPLSTDCARYTTLSLLRRARLHIQKLEEQEQRARRLKDRLRSEQRNLRQRLEQLRGAGGEWERLRVDSLDSSGLSSERSDTDQEELEVDVESLVFGGDAELLRGFSTGQEHSYSHSGSAWL